MEKSKLGNKQTCENCGTRFFDFAKTEIKCPNCDEVKLLTKSLPQKLEKAKNKPKNVEAKNALEENSDDFETEAETEDVTDDNFLLEEMEDYEEIEIEDGKETSEEN